MKRKTLFNIVLILGVVSFFVTPLGEWSKIGLNRVFASKPNISGEKSSVFIKDYNWKLKDDQWNFFNFEKSKNRVVFICFWASWHTPSKAQLNSIQKLYDRFNQQVDFYIITNEVREPVEKFMNKTGFIFKVTYLIIEEKGPFNEIESKIVSSYLIDKKGKIRASGKAVTNWNSDKAHNLVKILVNE